MKIIRDIIIIYIFTSFWAGIVMIESMETIESEELRALLINSVSFLALSIGFCITASISTRNRFKSNFKVLFFYVFFSFITSIPILKTIMDEEINLDWVISYFGYSIVYTFVAMITGSILSFIFVWKR